MRINKTSCAATSLLLLSLSATALFAGDGIGYQGWGPRMGVTLGPDQVHFGLHMDFGSFADHFRLQPNVEVGVSDARTLATFNLDTAYRFASRWDLWAPYLGGGIGLNVAGDGDGVRSHHDQDLGASLLWGLERGLSSDDRFFIEAKLGLVDSPDLKLGVGWTFY